ncbi:hypothetical protein ACFLQL_00115 [Verrucomicrobiota bacterium]
MFKFSDLLFKSDLIKSAAPDNPNQQQLEADFGNLAYTFLKDRAPQLVSYLLGFEIVEQEEDGSKAVGIFGFKINEDYFYIPTFFVNNQIKGMDMIYNKAKNIFFPLEETWVNYILDKQAVNLGKGVNKPASVRSDFEEPNFGFLATPYGVNKTAASSSKTATEIIKDAFDVWNDMQIKIGEMVEQDEEFKQAVACAISRLSKQSDLPIKKTAEDSKLIPFIKNHGGPKAVEVLLSAMDDYKVANAAMTFYPTVKSLCVEEFNMLNPKQAEKVQVITSVSANDTPVAVGQEDKQKIIRDGFTVKDLREPKEKSEMFATDYTKQFTTPSDPGKYDVLLSNGTTMNCSVMGPAKPDGEYLILINPENMLAIQADPRRVIAKVEHEVDSDIFKKAISLEDIKPNNKYILIDDKLNTSGIFEVRTVKAANVGRTEIDVSSEYNIAKLPTERGTWDAIDDHCYHGSDQGDIKVWQLADYDSDKLRRVGDKLVIPSNWKALEVKTCPYDDDKLMAVWKAFVPGTLLDLDEALFKNALHNMVVESADKGVEYLIYLDDFTAGPYNYKTATVKLIKDYGFDVDDVEYTLKEARDNVKARRLVKFAQFRSPMVGVSMPTPAEPQGYGDSYTGAMVQPPYDEQIPGQFTGVPSLEDPMVRGFNMGGESDKNLNQNITQLMDQAAQSGQKTIFDHAAVGGLSKTFDISHIIDTYLPEMVKSLDRVGRILFLFYWKNDDFADRYGAEDLVDMEDLLRNVFKNYGQLILQLKQKAISSNVDSLI